MAKKIKLIWDFRGPAATKTAEHHAIHLQEFVQKENLIHQETGFTIISEEYAMAYAVVVPEQMILVRDTLRPHRGEYL
jgi:hypothetical protein